jgi:uncharacterized protein YcfJ
MGLKKPVGTGSAFVQAEDRKVRGAMLERRTPMKSKPALTAVLTILLHPLASLAGYDDGGDGGAFRPVSYGYARVVRVTPIFRVVEIREPRERCWTEETRVVVDPRQYNVGASTVAGGAIGGLIGSRFGRGPSRVAGGFTGMVLGAIAGNAIAHGGNERAYPMERVERVPVCRDVSEMRSERQLDGYRVDYEYRGEMFRTRLPYRPGNQIQVRITADPVAR